MSAITFRTVKSFVDKNEKQKSEKDSGQLSVYYESEIVATH